MAYADLEEARRHHAALKTLIERHAGDAPDFRALRRAVDLCRGAAEAVDDAYCREKIRLAAEFAVREQLGEHAKWRRDALSGVDFLKQQALNALELFQSRVYSLEWMRRAAARAGARGFILNPRSI